MVATHLDGVTALTCQQHHKKLMPLPASPCRSCLACRLLPPPASCLFRDLPQVKHTNTMGSSLGAACGPCDVTLGATGVEVTTCEPGATCTTTCRALFTRRGSLATTCAKTETDFAWTPVTGGCYACESPALGVGRRGVDRDRDGAGGQQPAAGRTGNSLHKP